MSDVQKREKSKENEHFAKACRRMLLLVYGELLRQLKLPFKASGRVVQVIRAWSEQIREPATTGRGSKNTDQKRSTPIKRSKTSWAYPKCVDWAVLELNDPSGEKVVANVIYAKTRVKKRVLFFAKTKGKWLLVFSTVRLSTLTVRYKRRAHSITSKRKIIKM